MKSCSYLWPERSFEFGTVFCLEVFLELELLFLQLNMVLEAQCGFALQNEIYKENSSLGNND